MKVYKHSSGISIVMATIEELDETDRHARAYGYEIGRGQDIVETLEMRDANPFTIQAWREIYNLPSFEDYMELNYG